MKVNWDLEKQPFLSSSYISNAEDITRRAANRKPKKIKALDLILLSEWKLLLIWQGGWKGRLFEAAFIDESKADQVWKYENETTPAI